MLWYENNIYKMQKPQHGVTVSRSAIEITEGVEYLYHNDILDAKIYTSFSINSLLYLIF